jgi:tetratricopeptide (TPR) repeat protein/DNA-binding XRE family transcriptional regulator
MGKVGSGKVAQDTRGRFARGQAINPAALRQARVDAGMTLAQAADGIVSRQALHQFEAGKARPVQATLEAVATRLRVPIDALLARPRDPRELRMRELQEKQRWHELERLAGATLADLNVTPRTRAVAVYYLGHAILDQAPDEALTHFRRARGQLVRLGEPWLAAEARDWEGAALYLLQSPDAVDVGRDALARYRMLASRDPDVESRMLEHIGTYLLQREEVGEALSSYRQAIDVAGSLLNLGRLATIYHGLASGSVRSGNSRQALEYFERAVSFCRTDHDVRGAVTASLARLENDYGDLLIRTGRWERAEEMIRAALDHFAAIGVDAGRSYAMLSMGDLERQQRHLGEAMRWTNDAIEVACRLGETVSLALGYQQLGELFEIQGDLERFESSFSRALSILDNAGLPERRAEAMARYRRVRAARASELPASG